MARAAEWPCAVPDQRQRLLPRLQRRRHDRQHGRHCRPHAARRSPTTTRSSSSTTAAPTTPPRSWPSCDPLPEPARGDPPEEPRLRRRAAQRVRSGDQGADLLHRRRRPVRPARVRPADRSICATTSTSSRATRSSATTRCTASSSAASTTTIVRTVFGLHMRDVDCDFRLFRRHVFDEVPLDARQRRDLRRDDDARSPGRLPDRRGARAPLPPRVRPVAVLQLPPRRRTSA